MWNNEYNPDQMLNFCKTEVFQGLTGAESTVSYILALIAIEKDPISLVSKMKLFLQERCKTSIAQSLQRLHTISMVDDLEFGRTGLDALCYHLSIHTVNEAITALQKVKENFGVIDAGKH